MIFTVCGTALPAEFGRSRNELDGDFATGNTVVRGNGACGVYYFDYFDF